MADIAQLIQIVLWVALTAAPIIVLVALVRGSSPGSLSDLWSAPDDDAWPHGVQEEEPVRWSWPAATSTAGA